MLRAVPGTTPITRAFCSRTISRGPTPPHSRSNGPVSLVRPRRDSRGNTARGRWIASSRKSLASARRPSLRTTHLSRVYIGEQIGHRYMVAPYVFPGWLSQQWVIGVGRSPKVTQLYMQVAAFPSVGTWDRREYHELHPTPGHFRYLGEVVDASWLFRRT